MTNTNYTHNRIIVLAGILSIICSIIAISGSLPNNDGILYMHAAEAYLSSGLSEAFKVYSWPFYSIIIALCSKYTGLSVLNSSYFINTIFQVGIVLVFLNIFRKLNPTSSQLWFALITIIIFPQFNIYRHYILRDFGFWFFCLMAINNLINYSNDINTNRNVILYYLWFFLAFLFRTEAIFIALALPFSIFCLNFKHTPTSTLIWHNFYNLYKPIIYGLIILGILSILSLLVDNPFINIKKFTNIILQNLHFDLIKKFLPNYAEKIYILNNTIFPFGSNGLIIDYGFFIIGLLAVFVLKFIKVFNIFNFLFLSAFICNHKKQPNKLVNPHQLALTNNIKILLFAIFITIVIPTAFLYLVFITAGRYYILSALLLLLFVPFSLDYFWHKVKHSTKLLKFIAHEEK